MSSSPDLDLVARVAAHGDRTAIVAAEGVFTYAQLDDASARVAAALANGRDDLAGERVAFLSPAGFLYVATLLGIWRAGAVAVPLAPVQAGPEWEYILADSSATMAAARSDLAERLAPLADARNVRLVRTSDLASAPRRDLPHVAADRRALILYTSGTTSRPKGVVMTHANIQAQVRTLVRAWAWTSGDRILHVLPLNHVHGIINALLCALWSGAVCEMQPKFDAARVWSRFSDADLTLFMAVPTIYAKLMTFWETAELARREAMSAGCRALRLMVSGSAALPVSVLEKWRAISGHVLLERYGMTEIGMALSNPLGGERRPGYVGQPLPGVDVRLVDDDGRPVPAGTPGEIEVRGPSVFLEYWGRADATRDAFRDGWFRTGDVAVVEDGAHRILGRRSVDIIKTGGEKVSALEIEEVLRTHPDVRECAVVGVPDQEWGERVCAALLANPEAALTVESLRAWAKDRLAPAKVPSRIRLVTDLPRNTMGKVTKPGVRQLFE
jgi:malonyl-CoA/methylmalonyl-CoA synthetase